MEIVALLIGLVLILTSLGSLACFITVLIGMFTQEDSILHGLVGLLCCQLYVLIWGFAKWQSKYKGLVMTVWVICFILGIVLNVAMGVVAGSQGGGY